MAQSLGPTPSRVLLVEGPSDKHVVWHIWRRHAAKTPFCTVQKGGVDNLLAGIVTELKAPGRQALGILLDANTDPAGRWDAVKEELAQVNIPLPERLSPSGAIIDSRPRVGVWLMPDNRSPGELEDFVVKMIPAGDPVLPLSERYIAGIPPAARKFSEKKKLRAQLYAWLAAQADPRLMGAVIRAGDLEVDGALCQEFVAWLTRLFS